MSEVWPRSMVGLGGVIRTCPWECYSGKTATAHAAAEFLRRMIPDPVELCYSTNYSVAVWIYTSNAKGLDKYASYKK